MTGEVWTLLRAELGSDVIEQATGTAGNHVRVAAPVWRKTAEMLHEQGFLYFGFLSALDWLPNPDLDGEHVFDPSKQPAGPQEIVTDPEVRVAGGTSRFQVMARVENLEHHVGVTVVADLDGNDPRIASWTPVYAGADWHERETWEMFGITFEGHPNLRHIYLPDEFEGYPLRKDYPLVSRIVRPWPGLVDMEEMPPVPPPAEQAPAVEGAAANDEGGAQ